MKSAILIAVICSLVFCLPAVAEPLTGAQRGDLRKARNLILDARMHADRLEYYAAEWNGLGSQISEKRITDFNTSVKGCEDAFLKARDVMAKLPAGNEEADKLRTQMGEIATKYQKAMADAKTHLEGSAEAVEQAGGFEQINKDVERLSAIAYQFGVFDALIPQNMADAVKLLEEFRPAVQELQAVETKYADFLKKDNADTAQLKRKVQDARRQLEKVQTAALANVKIVAEQAGRNMDEAQRLIATGVAEQKPGFFGPDSGIEQHLGLAEADVAYLAIVQPEAAKPLAERLSQTKAKAKAAGDTMKSAILAQNRMPADAYTGSDIDALKAGLREAWLKDNPDDEVVKVVMPVREWKRETKWTWWRDAFYFTDRSDLQGKVVLRATNEAGEPELHLWPVDIAKNHEEGDAISYSPWVKEPLDQMPLSFRVPAENAK